MTKWRIRTKELRAYSRDVWQAATRSPLLRLLAAGAAGIALSAASAFAVAHYWEERNAQIEIERLGSNLHHFLRDKLTGVEQLIASAARALPSPAKETGPAQLAEAAAHLRGVFGSTLSVEWIPRIRQEERAAHELSAAALGIPGYRIIAYGKDGASMPAEAKDEYFPVYLSSRAPGAPSRAGFDISSDPAQQEALIRARDTGKVAATPPEAGPREIYLLAPVYSRGLPEETAEGRQRNIEGFLAGTFLPGALIDESLAGINTPQEFAIYFFHGSAEPKSLPFHVHAPPLRSKPPRARPRADIEAGPHWTGDINLAGTRWTIIAAPAPGGLPLVNRRESLAVLAVGVLITLGAITHFEVTRRNNLRIDAVRNRLTAATEYRSKLLNAVSIAAKELLTAGSIDDAMPKVFEIVGKTVQTDRVLVLENRHKPGAPSMSVLRYGWHSAAAPPMPSLGDMNPAALEDDPWFAPLREGKAVRCVTSAMPDGEAKTILQRLGIASSLDVPVVIEGKYWGRVCFDDCTAAREWTSLEADILRTLAELIASSIIRARYVEQLKNANMIIERSPTILFRLGGEPSLPLIYVSHNVRLFGYEPAEMIASPGFYKSIIHPDDELKILELMAQIVMGKTQSETVEFRMRKRDGTYRWVENHFTPIRDTAGCLIEIEGVLTDITEKKEAAEKIMVLARTDSLTGLANRATFIDRLRQAFASAKRGARPFAVLYLDLDRFKDVNDTLGHLAGDLLLKAVAARLKGCTRETDVVARLGGDEFAILQTDLNDVTSASVLASKVHDALAEPYHLGGSEMFVSASIGISPYTSATAGPEEMLAQADLALYRAKEEGRDQFCFHSPDLDREVRDRVTVANDLRHALEGKELELYYQPQIELAASRIVGMEALIRWNHPARGMLKPGDFLPIVEKTPLIVTLGQWVLDHACEQMSKWREARIAPSVLTINLSLGQLRSGDEFILAVTRTLEKWGLSYKDLEFDVTESMLAYVTLHQNSVLDRLRQLGVKIAIDDFGSQYSSLDYLRTYRVSRVKIPRPMIDAATKDPGATAMVRAIVGAARELDIEVIAKGVETEAQRQLLTCAPSPEKVQGFYYSAPVSAEDATGMLRQKLVEPRLGQIGGMAAAQ